METNETWAYLDLLAKPNSRGEFDTVLCIVANHPVAHIHFAELFVLYEALYEADDWLEYARDALPASKSLVVSALSAYHSGGLVSYVRTLREGGYFNDEG